MLEKIRGSSFFRFMKLVWEDAIRINVFNDAYAMAYVTLFSLIPSLAATFALIGIFMPFFGENSSIIDDARSYLLRNLATGSGEQVVDYLENFLANTDFKKIGITGFAGTLVTLTLLLKQIEEALNRIFEVKLQRTMIERFLYFWTFLTLGTFCLAISVGTLSAFSFGSKYIDLSFFAKMGRDLMYIGSIYLFFMLIYKFGPNRFVPWRSSIIGALIGTTMLVQAIRFFSLYVSSFTRYQAIYGALSALPIFLLWLYVIWLITLFGALIVKRLTDGIPRAHFRSEKLKGSIRDDYFDIILPLLVLFKAYEAFESEKGDGASPEHIAKDLYVSTTIVQAAFDKLTKADLVVPHHLNGKRGKEDLYFPRMPKERLSFDELKTRMLGSTDAWLSTIDGPSKPEQYEAAIQAFLVGDKAVLAKAFTDPSSSS